MESDTLIKEKNLWQIYRECKKLPKSEFNQLVTIIFLFIILVYYINIDIGLVLLSRNLNEWADLALSYSSSLLGFIIAGYTILISLSPSELFIKLANAKNDQRKLSYLQILQFPFIEVFIYFCTITFLSIVIKAVFTEPMLVRYYISLFDVNDYLFTTVLVKFVSVSFLTLIVFSVMKLKSFIYNIYGASMMLAQYASDNGDSSGE